MTRSPPFLEEPEDTREEILKATYDAICKHGYSDLTIQRIGEEFPKSKSLVYHHYDGKDDLLLDLLEFVLNQAEEQFPLQMGTEAVDQIEAITDIIFLAEEISESELSISKQIVDDDFTRTQVDLRAQAVHDEDYREIINRTDHFAHKHIEYIIRSGIEQGVLRDVDPEQTAALFQIVSIGVTTQKATSDNNVVDEAREAFERYVRECLLREE